MDEDIYTVDWYDCIYPIRKKEKRKKKSNEIFNIDKQISIERGQKKNADAYRNFAQRWIVVVVVTHS